MRTHILAPVLPQGQLDTFFSPSLVVGWASRHLDKTLFHLRIAEIARENSSGSALVAMTLPLPVGSVPCALYMAWLDFVARNMPPFLFVRGNQESVLTFYS